MEHNCWYYPDGPVENVFGSHPSYDEAHGPYDPNGFFVPVDELCDSDVFDFEALSFDEDVELETLDEFVADEQTFISAAQPYVEEAVWTPPIVEMRVFLKEFKPGSRRWGRVLTCLPITA